MVWILRLYLRGREAKQMSKKITKTELKEILMIQSLQTALDIHAFAFSSKEYVINDLLDYSNGQLTEMLKRYGWNFEIVTKK